MKVNLVHVLLSADRSTSKPWFLISTAVFHESTIAPFEDAAVKDESSTGRSFVPPVALARTKIVLFRSVKVFEVISPFGLVVPVPPKLTHVPKPDAGPCAI